jgi:acetyl-CoA C-acetyltransferase
MSEVAATNPYAWFPNASTAAELATVTADNRLVGYPYTKREVAIMDVDQAAAVILATHEAADRLGVAAERRVYLRGWCAANDPTYVAEHEPLWSSPAMRAASDGALGVAGATIDDVAHLDLYSCFASSIAFGLDALGLAADDTRPVTVTGGLPFAGGPGSNYLTHAVAAMAARLRGDPGSLGLVSGVGMHMTKHVYALYSTRPPSAPLTPPDPLTVQAAVDAAHPPRAIADTAEGVATVAAYSVVHGRGGGAEWGLLVCDLPTGERCYAKAFDADLLRGLEQQEWVGRTVELVRGEGQMNVAKL